MAKKRRKQSRFPIRNWVEEARKKHWINRAILDYELLTIILLLIVFGIVMIYSASYYYCSVSTSMKNDPYAMTVKQIRNAGIGLAAMLAVSMIDYRRWAEYGLYVLAYVFGIVLTMLLKTPIGVTVNQATRWLNLFGLQFQVADVMKLLLIEFMAVYLAKYPMPYNQFECTRLFLLVGVSAALLGIISNNMSAVIIIMAMCCCMIFVSRPNYRFWFICIGVTAVIVTAALLFIYKNHNLWQSENNQLAQALGFRLKRILAWMFPEEYESGQAMQPLYAKYAIGYGGFWGRGLGKSLQKYKLPEPYNDFILAILAEELGFVGVAILMVLFTCLLVKIYYIARSAVDNFGKLFALGVMCHLAVQLLLNVAVASNFVPTTGVTLPFISAGGTSIIFLLIELGVVFSIDKVRKEERARVKCKRDKEKKEKQRNRNLIGV